MFRGKWTEEIHGEWMGKLMKNRPELSRDRLQRTRERIDAAGPDCLVTEYEDLIPAAPKNLGKSMHCQDNT